MLLLRGATLRRGSAIFPGFLSAANNAAPAAQSRRCPGPSQRGLASRRAERKLQKPSTQDALQALVARPRGKDLLEDAADEDLVAATVDGADVIGGGAGYALGPDEMEAPISEEEKLGPLARKMWKCAKIGVRCPEVWARFSQRVLATGPMIGAKDTALIFLAYARIKYRDKKVLDAMSPFLLRHIHNFSSMEVVLLANAHKKLEYERLDNLQLLVNATCDSVSEWTGRHISLGANAVAHFYIYQPRFWRLVAQQLPKLVWSMNPLELSNLVCAMARVDRRDPRSLAIIARMCKRCAQRQLFSQETLATTVNGFAKLDFNHPKLSKAFEDAAIVKLDRALELGPDYRKSSLRDEDVFDVQALVLLLHSLVCFVGTSDDVLIKLLTLVSWSKDEVSDFQRRSLKTACTVVRRQHKGLFRRLPVEVRNAIYAFEHVPAKVPTNESRWGSELRAVLKRMDVQVELKPVVDDQVLDIFLPSSNSVVCAVGPYSYYTNSTHRTAYSKLHQRLLEMEGYSCMVVPYYEWTELKTEEDKMVYLWSLGRRAAARNRAEDSEATPTFVGEELQSDLSDIGEARR